MGDPVIMGKHCRSYLARYIVLPLIGRTLGIRPRSFRWNGPFQRIVLPRCHPETGLC